MATTIMPKPNEALREFFSDNRIFAALFNDYLFREEVIQADELEIVDSVYSESVKAGKKIQKIQRFRDIIRKTTLGYCVILAIEDQDRVHYAMPIRNMLYDALGYCNELSNISNSG